MVCHYNTLYLPISFTYSYYRHTAIGTLYVDFAYQNSYTLFYRQDLQKSLNKTVKMPENKKSK